MPVGRGQGNGTGQTAPRCSNGAQYPDWIFIGATIGNASEIGSETRKDSTKQGAVFGALAGAVESGDDVKLGPRRIMDRCIANRGYDLLNDIP